MDFVAVVSYKGKIANSILPWIFGLSIITFYFIPNVITGILNTRNEKISSETSRIEATDVGTAKNERKLLVLLGCTFRTIYISISYSYCSFTLCIIFLWWARPQYMSSGDWITFRS